MNANVMKFGLAAAAAGAGVLGLLLLMKHAGDLPLIKDAKDVF